MRVQTLDRSALLDLAAQQGAFWGAVLLVRNGHGASACLPSLLVVALAVWLRGPNTLGLAALAGMLGFVADTSLVQLRAIAFPHDGGAQLTPMWMVALWCAFGTAFSGSMAWLGARGPVFSAAIGGIGGLLAYRSGASLGVLAIGNAPGAWLAIVVAWAAAVALLRLAALQLTPAARKVPA